MQSPVTVLPYGDDDPRRNTCSTATSAVALTGRQTATQMLAALLANKNYMRSLLTFKTPPTKIPLYSSRYVRAFSSESATCVIRLRRPRKVYTIDDAICSLLEVIDALKNHGQALEQEGKLCNMTSAAKKSKVRHRSEVFVGCSGGVVPRRR